MIKSDRIYQVLLKYDFDLFRGSKSIADYITDHFTQYYSEILSATDGENEFLGDTFVDRLCDYAELLYSCRKIKAQKTVDGAPSDKKKFLDVAVIESQYKEFNSIAKRILRKHTVFDFTFENMGNFEKL